jgi:hypothetical protein
MTPITICILITIVVILLILYRVGDQLPGLLQDQSTVTGAKPYSLSRSLFCLWTLLMFFALCFIGIYTGQLPKIDPGTLLLMGIASGTTLVSRTIDRIQSGDTSFIRIQDAASGGFWKDILSDQNGISISRLQTLCFNLIYAAIFVSTVISKQELYPFDHTALTLLGISSGAYALLKIPEARHPSFSALPVPMDKYTPSGQNKHGSPHPEPNSAVP